MRKVKSGNTSYPYGNMLNCPYCGQALVHGNLNRFTYCGKRIKNGGWGCYGKSGCKSYLILQSVLDDAIIRAYKKKYGEIKEKVDFYWIEDSMDRIVPNEDSVKIYWRDGSTSVERMTIEREGFYPSEYAEKYNTFIEQVKNGERKTKFRFLMGLDDIIKEGENDNYKNTGRNKNKQAENCRILPCEHKA